MDKTDKQAVYDIATKLGYEGAYGPSIASGIYAVALALGYTGATDGDASQALQALYTVAGSGGGGGGDLGALGFAPCLTAVMPVVSETSDAVTAPVSLVSVAGDAVCRYFEPTVIDMFAAGTTLTLFADANDYPATSFAAYVCKLGEGFVYQTVDGWNGTLNVVTDEDQNHIITLVMPELGEFEILVIVATT